MLTSPVSRNHYRQAVAVSPSKSSPARGGGKISLRVDQPIEGCQMLTHAIFRSVDGELADKDVEMKFRWYRSSLRRACANAECPRRGQGNVLLLPATVECLACARIEHQRDHARFCGLECFRSAWHQHKHLHKHTKAASTEDEDDDEEPDMVTKQSRAFSVDALSPEDDETWDEISSHNDRSYRPTEDDVGHVLRVVCEAVKSNGTTVLTKSVETGLVLPFPPMPPKRQMLANVHEEHPTPRLRQIGAFRVLTYNTLSEIYATRQCYPYCPVWALSWSFRFELLKRELQSYNADILCMQEVQGDHYKKFLSPLMAEWGYEGWYIKKTREAMGVEGKMDGCAFFYKRTRFIMKEQYGIEFNEIANELLSSAVEDFNISYPGASMADRDAFQSTINSLQMRLMRDNVGQIVVLEVIPSNTEVSRKQTGPLLCVANVHILANPKFPDVKVWQTLAMVKQIERVALPRNLPAILCGDFNSEPSSAVYELMTRNTVPLSHPDLDRLADLFAAMDVEHHLNFASAYASVFGSEPEYTNFTGHWAGVVDYMWYTRDWLTPFAGLKVHPPEVLEAYAKTALPNCQYMSDHVPLCLDFCFKAHALPSNGRYPC